jgi:uncharacterized membrane protein
MLQIQYILFIDEPLLGTGSIVGIVVGLLCAIVIIVIVIVYKRNRRNQKDESIDGMSYLPNNSDTFCVIVFRKVMIGILKTTTVQTHKCQMNKILDNTNIMC